MTVALILLALSFVALSVRWLAQARIRQLKVLEALEQQFFEAANELVANDETPEAVINVLDSARYLLGYRRVGFKLLLASWTGKFRKRAASRVAEFAEMRAAIRAMPDPLRTSLVKAMVTGALAMTYRSVFWGWLLRRTVFWRVSQSDSGFTGAGDARDALLTIGALKTA